MSLRTFHLGFISMAIFFCLGSSYRSFQLAQLQSTVPFETMGGASLLMALLLLGYSAWYLRSKKTNFLPAVLVAVSLWTSDLMACETCYGDGKSALARGATAGGVVLLGMGAAMILAYAALGYLWSRRATKL